MTLTHRHTPALVVLLPLIALTACAHVAAPVPATPPADALDVDDVARLIPARVKERAGWAADVVTAIAATDKVPTAERVCAVLAVVEQESGYHADPAVKDLPDVVRRGLLERLSSLGPLARPTLDVVLARRVPGGTETFAARIAQLRTERDLDRFFRDVTGALEDAMPVAYTLSSTVSSLVGGVRIDALNPVTTAGSMQVKVAFAQARARRLGLDDDAVRELLYTRAGGVRFGTARLIDYPARYDDVVYRFADFNAGVYASRNAQLQAMLADLTGIPLALDGDLLAWDERGAPRDVETHTLRALRAFAATHGLSSARVENDARLEKSIALEDTRTWHAVRAAWAAKHGTAPAYARVPDVALSSPKLSRELTTSWFAHRVKARYDACRKKERAGR